MNRRQASLAVRSLVALAFGLAALPVLFVTGSLVVGYVTEIVLAIVGTVAVVASLPLVLALDAVGVVLSYPSVPDGPLFPSLWQIHPFLFWALVGALEVFVAAVLYLWVSARDAVADTREPTADEQRLVSAVDRLARQADVPSPSVRVATDDRAMAYTVRYRGLPTVVVSEGLVETLDPDELEATLAHEVAHVVNGDLRVATGFSLLALLAALPAVVGDALRAHGSLLNALGGALFVLGLVTGALGLLQAAIVSLAGYVYFPAREYAADDAAAAMTGDPAALATALETLHDHDHEPPTEDLRAVNRVGATLNVVDNADAAVWVTHPPVERRIDRLRERARAVGS